MRRGLNVTALCLLALGLSLPSRAEVRVVTDRTGSYKMTRVLQTGRGGNVWSPLARARVGAALNPLGDRNGDLFPTIRENTASPHYPWVVWSRFNAVEYDLAWSRWTDEGWQPIRWVEPAAAATGDNLDADLSFDGTGRPYVVWWRDVQGTGQVFLSVFLQADWMTAFAVSADGLDSRYPTVRVEADGAITVRYSTPEGTVEQRIAFDMPVTITDDINPLDYVHTESTAFVHDEN